MTKAENKMPSSIPIQLPKHDRKTHMAWDIDDVEHHGAETPSGSDDPGSAKQTPPSDSLSN
ncbi:hypothetical protein [uncultured Bradyrhizobium sp.]|jgi:hypothetical protein|uniref:hypothetical protein n=1 Tax=uncultured Bradyrhizobium sp. TaxID=199684 RepID=UPI00260E9ADE|nr:hypothetical protein [uncultured Bradyrhizobium sp.]